MMNFQPDIYVCVEFSGVANTNGSRNWEAAAASGGDAMCRALVSFL
jgi:hypothetical protein